MTAQTYVTVESSNIDSVAHADGTLFVKFKNGSEYKYTGVPVARYEALLAAESKGKYLNSEVKPNYPFERI